MGFRKFCARLLLHVAEFDRCWLALVGWHAAACIVPPRALDRLVAPAAPHKPVPVANKSRFLGLPGAGRTPRLVSRVLGRALMPQFRQCMIAGMRIATWCVGGINSRWKYLCHWLRRRKPDVVALQKTFASTDHFPREALQQAGYESVFYTRDGEFRNGWGVAVLSRETLPQPRILQTGLPGQEDRGARFLTVGVGDLEFSSVYALYGDPGNYGVDGAIQRKIAWMKLLHEHLEERSARSGPCVLAGDFNVVTDGPPQRRTVNYTEEERGMLTSLLDLGFVDLYRLRHPDTRTGRNYEFNIHKPVSTRLHRILGTQAVASQIHEAWVDLEYRKEIKELEGGLWAQSAPVIVDLSSEDDS